MKRELSKDYLKKGVECTDSFCHKQQRNKFLSLQKLILYIRT